MNTPEKAIPSRLALLHAQEARERTGMELGGFLSEENGFLPLAPRPKAFPSSHAIWDQMALDLPAMWRDVDVRRACADMPVLDASPDSLPDEYLWRAATILGTLAHAYVRSEIDPPPMWADSIERPWHQVVTRLGRRETFMQGSESVFANFHLRDPDGPIERPNLEVIAMCVHIPAELRFNWTVIEMHADAIPLVGAVVRAQEAALARDTEAVRAELLGMIETLAVVRNRLNSMDPNPYSDLFIDPVIWGTLIAPLAVSIKPHVAGPGGTASPIFHTFDAFLGRADYKSALGHEALRLREISPPLHQEWIVGVAQNPIGPLVEASGSRELKGLLSGLIDAYAGEQGMLGLHRTKAYGYLGVAFRGGRPVTIGGFGGTFLERPWLTVDAALEDSRLERRARDMASPHLLRVAERTAASSGSPVVKQIVLDAADRGVVYRPGDRIGVLPDNEVARVERTAAALGATGEEKVPLTLAWKVALRDRPGYTSGPDAITLTDFLRFAALHPMARTTVKALQRIADSAGLKRLLELRGEEQWEFADVLATLTADGYNVRRLVDAEVGEPEALAKLLAPLAYRLYSISSAPEHGDNRPADTVQLTVGTLEYQPGASGPVPPHVQRGTGSVYVNEFASDAADSVVTHIVRPQRFRLPDSATTPIVMFAGGTGISPFVGFLERLRAAEQPRAAWLVFGTRSATDFHYRDLIADLVRAGRLRVSVAFSREAVEAKVDGEGSLALVPGIARRVDELIAQEPIADDLWQLVHEQDAALYVCGQAGFATAVIDSIRAVAGSRLADEAAGVHLVRRLVATDRLMLDVFTTVAPVHGSAEQDGPLVDASELVLHNDDEHGRWFAMQGAVYDLSEFQHLHPGGHHILRVASGIDAEHEWIGAQHDRNPGIVSMLAMYRSASMRRLDLGRSWGIALLPGGLSYVTVEDAYRRWVRFLYLVTEMQSAYINDLMYLEMPTTSVDGDTTLTRLKIMLFGDTHARFSSIYFPTGLGPELDALWAITAGFADENEDAAWIRHELDRIEAEHGARFAEGNTRIRHLYRAATTDEARAAAKTVIEGTVAADNGLLADLKMTLREGAMLFEQHEARTMDEAGAQLLATMRGIPGVVHRYYDRLADVTRNL